MDNELAARLGIVPRNYLVDPNMIAYPSIREAAPVIPTENKSFLGKISDRLFGGSDVARVPDSLSYPTPRDVHYAQMYDLTYGTPMAGFTVPGAKVAQVPLDEILGGGSSEVLKNARLQDLSPENRETFLQNYIAAQKHPVSAIGYDPHNITYTPNTRNSDISLEGFYRPSEDSIWYYGKNQDSVIHEAFHRGIQKLKDAGMLPEDIEKSPISSEDWARLLMLKNFGDIEVTPFNSENNKQIEHAKWWLENNGWKTNKLLGQIEKAAQDYIAKENPKGPR